MQACFVLALYKIPVVCKQSPFAQVLPLVIAKHLGTFNYYKHSTCRLPGLIANVGTADHVL